MEEEERIQQRKFTFQSRRFFKYFRTPHYLFIFLGILTRIHCETLQAPRFITQPSSASNIVNEGGTKILQCQALGYPMPVYKWLKDEIEVVNFTSNHYYKIHNANLEDAGSYQCVAKNDVGAILSQRIDVKVAFMGQFEDTSERVVSVLSGEAAVLDLPSIESYPDPLVSWQTDDGSSTLYNLEFATSAVTHQLVILAVSKKHEKAYRAHATNTQIGQEENSPYVRVDVKEDNSLSEILEPQIVVRPRDANIVKGKLNTELECIANARPLHALRTYWLKNGVPIENAGIEYNFNDPWNRTISLMTANMSGTETFTCRVVLPLDSFPKDEAHVNINVLEPPMFASNLRQETVGEFGSIVRLPCESYGVPRPNITWYRNAISVLKIAQQHNRYVVDEDGTLIIRKLRMEDSGMFQCIAINDAGSDYVTTWLKVKTSAPFMETPPRNVTVLDGKDIIITCRVGGAPLPNTTWFYGDEDIIIEQNGRFQYLELGDLLIVGVRTQDEGKYTCVRENEAGRVAGSAFLSVLIGMQIIQGPADTRVLLGQDATLQCRVSHNSTVPYQLDWFHNNALIGRGSQRVKVLADGTLVINAVRPADVGEYTCSLTSSGGNENRTARVTVIELPFNPINVRATRVDQRSVDVSWTPGFDGNSPILKYIIQKREVPELGPLLDPLLNWITEISNISSESTTVRLSNLKAATSYQFRVSAVNSVGEGAPSDPSNIIQLPQEPPSGPPVGFAGTARSSSEIITQWQPPMEDVRNGVILGYVIRYRLFGYNDSPWTYHNVTNEAQRNYLIQDLITWKDYVLQIAAFNHKGVGTFSDSVKIKTKEGIPDASPVYVKAKPANSTAIHVWWKPPNPQKINGINQGYKIQAWIGDTSAHVLTVAPSLLDPLAQQSAVMVGLDKFTEYNVTVLCFTDPGDGPTSQPALVRTEEDVPDEVENLSFHNVSDRSLTVLWSPPKHINGILKGYSVSYMVKDKPETTKTENLTEEKRNLSIINLQATTHYRFEVYAWTRVGAGAKKVATIQSGVEPVLPLAPSKLAITNIEAFSVVLQFKPGFDGNSSIIRWIVEAQTTRNTSWFAVYEEYNPEATTLTVKNLVPFTSYRLRLIAANVVGSSEPSDATKEFQTIQAPPAHPPYNVTVRAMSATELRVRWIPLQQAEWFGNARGYNISYRELSGNGTVVEDAKKRSVTIDDPTCNSHILDNMEEFAVYEINMTAFNDVDFSLPSPPAVERTRESVPSSGPLTVSANTTSSTTIVVKWGQVPLQHRNGQIEGYKVYYSVASRSTSPPLFKDIPNNATFTATLTELKKYTQYNVQVLAYTRLGDGVLTNPPIRVQTFDDTPGAPSNLSFPDVSLTTARIIWDIPEEPNGEILAYRVDYQLQASAYQTGSSNFSREFSPSDRTFRASELEPEQYYMFSVTAQSRIGWGKTAQALVYTTNNRERPEAPSTPYISRSQIQATQITFSWTPGRDGYAPLRYYTVQKSESNGPWLTVPQLVEPSVTSYTVSDLTPFTEYRFRIQAFNDLGASEYSHDSPQVRTAPAAPSKSISLVKVVPITTTSVRVYWETIPEKYWSGDATTGGYHVLYQPVSDFPSSLRATPKQDLHGIRASEVILSDLTRNCNYEIVVVPFNSQGTGPASTPVAVYVGEAVPTGEPNNVEGEAVSATEVKLRWQPPQQNQQNGDLLGYKIFYLVTESAQMGDAKVEEETEVVPATYTSHSLVFLDKYTQYRIQILAFNPAGDGPRSLPIIVKTHQGLPGPPSDLTFSEITMNSLLVSWQPPKKKNGELTGYIVTYETVEQNEEFSKQVKQKVSETNLTIQTLEEEVTYMFTVRAQTIDLGPPIRANVTTGPQEGSPTKPTDLSMSKTMSSVEIKWINGASGKGPILGYYIQSKRKDDVRWSTVVRTTYGPVDEFSVSYQSLLPSTLYSFRVIAYNKYGISYPLTSNEVVLTPSKLYLEYGYLKLTPFYRQTWFMVALAATSIIIIIMVISVLCVKSKSYKYKQEAQKVLEESMVMDIDDRQQLAMELYRSRRNTYSSSRPSTSHMASLGKSKRVGCSSAASGSGGTLSRKMHHQSKTAMAKSPPRPSPASVHYHSDEESLKGYDENPDDSSLTEKPSEISSSDSQASESEIESVRSDPHSFVNHYANVNDSLRQSWKRQKPVRNYATTFTDSEPDSANGVVPLQGGHIIMNNMARSRAPLPGFSSFV